MATYHYPNEKQSLMPSQSSLEVYSSERGNLEVTAMPGTHAPKRGQAKDTVEPG